jgi:hypothetical protein
MFCTGDPQKAKRGEKSERSFITHGMKYSKAWHFESKEN